MTTETELKLGDGKPKPAGTWDYYGACDPVHSRTEYAGYQNAGFNTFSIGVFQWVAKSSCKGTKKSSIVKRFSGNTAQPWRSDVYAEAIAFIKQQEQKPC